MNYQPAGMGGRRFKLFPIAIFIVLGAIFYFSNQETVPVTGRKQFVRISREQESALGLQSFAEVLKNSAVISSGPEADLVRRVGKKIAQVADDPGYEWEFVLIDSPQANAFCLPGGKVAVYSGILPIAKNEDGLAVIMAHEISHAIARHGAERMAQQELFQLGELAVGMAVSDMDYQKQRAIMGVFGAGAQFGVLLPFSRKHESEADYIGLQYVSRACFDPREAPLLWERMGEFAGRTANPPEFMSTHPSDRTRVEQFNSWMDEAVKLKNASCRR